MSVEELEGKDRDEMKARLFETRGARAYEAKENEVTPEIMRMVESQYIMLPIIDRLWVDHLYIMDALKAGIGLRGYGQKDPRVEYEKEAYEIFEDLKNNIADEAIKAVFRVVIEHEPPPQEMVPHPPASSSSRFRPEQWCRKPRPKAVFHHSRPSSCSDRLPVRHAARSNCIPISATVNRQSPRAPMRRSGAMNFAPAEVARSTRSATAPVSLSPIADRSVDDRPAGWYPLEFEP